ncbi:MAG: FUSC family protein [Clostridium sp.]|nr:FUSC family protein [Clostridium sp.]
MMKKIITKTILFVGIVMFVNFFGKIFGENNTLIGVSTVIASLVLLEKNLTNRPIMNFLELLITNIILGVLSFMACKDIWFGVVTNFLVLASIGYIFSYNLSKKMIIPFGLQYLFMLYTPIESSELGLRLLSLVSGAIVVMLLQFIAHIKTERNPEIQESFLFDEGEDDHDDTYVKILGKTYDLHPVRAGYAIRVGLLTSLTTLVSTLLGLEQGKWIAFTVFSITEFYSEHCKIKSKERMKGTLIGAIIVVVLFMFIKDDLLRSLVILLAGYLNPFADNYKDMIVCVTVSSVASVALTNGTLLTAIERIVYVFIGIIISLIANKYVLKTTEKEYGNKKS